MTLLGSDMQTPHVEDQPTTGCDFCGSQSYTLLFWGPDRLMGLPGAFSLVRCISCGLIYQHPQLPWDKLQFYYQGDYASYTTVVQDDISPIRRFIRRLGGIKQRRYVERFRQSGSMLDIGCGTGLFLAEMQLTGRWHLTGLEPTHQAADYVRNRLRIPVAEQVFEEADLPAASYDVITMWHVLEHVTSPTGTLSKVWRLLKPGGYFIFSIPNYESLGRMLFGRFWIGWDLPRHLFIFPRAPLKRIVEANGFRVVDARCFLISYDSLGLSLTFWLASWPQPLQMWAKLLRRVYYTPVTRLVLYPLQRIVEALGISTVATWTIQKVDSYGPHEA